ncbi:hypothetical protein JCM21714_4655 [Gracilibacillus boraciitolerans JCM 21714]|uniref:Uncharacterized protein n=1 Tax=Gracilibacillus boraciitolerans JCM 21714 TaxID=1298598 RepID=W4VQC9_9BACI|nr:YaaL family protein [Gracilibacillus boraciitolerans]GAE95417.1 hypothetical protein JCM21714_4655 [Gracilibacillus boraciitolerans JCM 21714]
MVRSKKVKKEIVDEKLLDTIFLLKREWAYLDSIMARSIDPTEYGRFDVAVAKAKYFYCLREAKERNLSAIK